MSRRLGLVMLAASLASCGSTPGSGELGTIRFIGRVNRESPVPAFPPISDRVGNIYTLFGRLGLPQASVQVSKVAGGSSVNCALTKGDRYGAHGWAGFSDDRAWYWSGDALVVVPASGGCDRVLNADPQTSADLLFRAVMPFVRVTSTRHTLVALVQNPSDTLPFSALVDLDRALMTNVAAIPAAGTVQVLGVGAEENGDDHVTLLARTTGGGAPVMEALFFDVEANLTARVTVQGLPPPEYGILGELRTNDQGVVVGLTSLGNLVVFNRSGGGTVAVDASITPVGVHRWDGALYLVGTSGTRPVILPLDAGGHPGQPITWQASEDAAANLAGALDVRDDRSFPTRQVTWTGVTSTIGSSPFLGPFSPWPHAKGTTLLLLSGPIVNSGGGVPVTSVAIAPVGIRYP